MLFAPAAMWAANRPITLAYLSRVTSTTSGTSFSFTSYSFGAADASRNIVVAVGGDASTTGAVPSSVTIGGISATMLVGQAGSTGSNPPGVSLWMAAVPTGTSGTIAVTFAASHNACVVDGWSLKGPSSPALSSAAQTYAGTGAPSWSVSVLAGGVIIGAAASSGTASFTWSGLTERSDGTFGSRTYSAADLASAAAQTITATGTASGGSNRVGVVVALR